MTGTVTHVQRREALERFSAGTARATPFAAITREVWFHKLTEGVTVAFEPGKQLFATEVRPVTASV
jgi:hypothetical protein